MKLIFAILILFVCATVRAANPSYENFDKGQFTNSGTAPIQTVHVRSGAILTNIVDANGNAYTTNLGLITAVTNTDGTITNTAVLTATGRTTNLVNTNIVATRAYVDDVSNRVNGAFIPVTNGTGTNLTLNGTNALNSAILTGIGSNAILGIATNGVTNLYAANIFTSNPIVGLATNQFIASLNGFGTNANMTNTQLRGNTTNTGTITNQANGSLIGASNIFGTNFTSTNIQTIGTNVAETNLVIDRAVFTNGYLGSNASLTFQSGFTNATNIEIFTRNTNTMRIGVQATNTTSWGGDSIQITGAGGAATQVGEFGVIRDTGGGLDMYGIHSLSTAIVALRGENSSVRIFGGGLSAWKFDSGNQFYLAGGIIGFSAAFPQAQIFVSAIGTNGMTVTNRGDTNVFIWQIAANSGILSTTRTNQYAQTNAISGTPSVTNITVIDGTNGGNFFITNVVISGAVGSGLLTNVIALTNILEGKEIIVNIFATNTTIAWFTNIQGANNSNGPYWPSNVTFVIPTNGVSRYSFTAVGTNVFGFPKGTNYIGKPF